jgi:hypothetical protein
MTFEKWMEDNHYDVFTTEDTYEFAKEVWQAALAEGAKAALGCRVPLTAEQVDEVFPSKSESHQAMLLSQSKSNYTDLVCYDYAWRRCLDYLRESIKKRLGAV